MTVSQARLQVFLARAYYDVAATETAALVVLGARRGFYHELAREPLSAAELAERTSSDFRFVASWLANQIAAGYVTVGEDKFSLSEEQSAAFTDEHTIGFLPAAFELAVGLAGQTHGDVPSAMNTLARAKATGLLDRWLDDGLRTKLGAGARVLDLGCGRGAAGIELARRYPSATVVGIDPDATAIAHARRAGSSVRFETEWTDAAFDMVLTLESFHEMSAPNVMARRVRQSLNADGAWIIVEPLADPGSTAMRLIAATDLLFCFPSSSPDSLGPLAGEALIRHVLDEAGFTRIRRREDGYHLVLDARP